MQTDEFSLLKTPLLKKATSLKNMYVVTEDSGRMVGKIDSVLINPDLNKISAIFVKERFWKAKGHYVPISEILLIGEQVVLIKSLDWSDNLRDIDTLEKRNFSNLQGSRVTSHNGEILGYLEDIVFSSQSGNINELYLTDGKSLILDNHDVSIGRDEIIVAGYYVSRLNIQNTNDPENTLHPH